MAKLCVVDHQPFSSGYSTFPVPSCDATRSKHGDGDTARLPKPRHEKSRGGGQVRTTNFRLGQPGTIPDLMLLTGGMAGRHRKGATAERFDTTHKTLLYA
ncbi:hypothetical protein T265_06115 [Opisthorchis viverrini]|uniref:Uncharacterized protein n=1 Tax=Opisthorchis viverrini TaxID=6198 RepID=A0A074ZI91_OPIVI|nr:hypothetical protein T265_06115 [Opisthorchis viverrini]KER26681.1 hypothetical protein T265_06115 [Opisthorchis viverrini]